VCSVTVVRGRERRCQVRRAFSYALARHDEYRPFEFMPAADDEGHERHTALTITYPEHLNRWKPLHKWFLAIPHFSCFSPWR
jgi:hypothetical protein